MTQEVETQNKKAGKDYGLFICPICNKLGQIERGVLVPQQLNITEKVMVHKRCEATAYKFLMGDKK